MNKATYKRAFNWGMVYNFRGRVHNHHGEHDSRQADWHSTGAVAQFIFYPQAAGRSLKAYLQRHSSSNKATPNSSQRVQLGTKHSDRRLWGHSHSNHHKVPLIVQSLPHSSMVMLPNK